MPLDLENSGVSYLSAGAELPDSLRAQPQEAGRGLRRRRRQRALKLDDDMLELKPWDAVRIAQGHDAQVRGGPEGAEIIAFGAPNAGPGDAKTKQGWWTD